MAMTVDELRRQLTMDTYTPKTDEQMREEANQQYASQYNQKKLSAQQTYDQTDLALTNQLASLGQSYEKQREAAGKATRASQSSLDRYSLQRGMQRSSFNAASQANILSEGEKTLADINQTETNARQSLESQRTQLASQLAAQLGQYDVDYASDVQAYFNQLKQQDETARTEADKYRNQLLMALYEYEQQNGGSSGGGGSGGSRGGGSSSSSAAVSTLGDENAAGGTQNNSAYDQFLNMFSGTASKTGKASQTKLDRARGGLTRTISNAGKTRRPTLPSAPGRKGAFSTISKDYR